MTAPWVEVLRAACAVSTQGSVATRLGYSAAVVNQVLKGTYKGDLQRVQRAVEGALMGSVVDCPIVGQIPRQRCVEHQRAPFRATNPSAVQLYRACRGGCVHSLIKTGDAGKETS
jgi:DNA-binding transcriptional regulator YdaS (Cro superfamily)